jgi:predicted AAA+ superfamily ATPase
MISPMIPRDYYFKRVQEGLKRSPMVALLGPRQCGKTTLARQLISEDSANYFDLEDPAVTALMQQLKTALESRQGHHPDPTQPVLV